ncbi:hypothetical protein TNCV_630751 [Trichonephila clavipes]|nr:hypothetical protein TNCV_630751 [Trichonephila clavipes]
MHHINCDMLTLPETALLEKLYYPNEESVTAALRSHRQHQGVKDFLRVSFGKDRRLSRNFHLFDLRDPQTSTREIFSYGVT